MKKGQIVHITFLDHVHSSQRNNKAIKFDVFGKVVYVDSVQVCVASWIYKDKRYKYDHHNNTIYTLVRSAILEYKVLVPEC